MDSGSLNNSSTENLNDMDLAKKIFLKKQSKSMINNQLVYKSNIYITLD